MPVDKVIAALASASFEVMPYAEDGDFFVALSQETTANWGDSIMIGDCGFEASVYVPWVPLWTTASLIQDFFKLEKTRRDAQGNLQPHKGLN